MTPLTVNTLPQAPARRGGCAIRGEVAIALHGLFEAGVTSGDAVLVLFQRFGVRIAPSSARRYRVLWGFPPGRPGFRSGPCLPREPRETDAERQERRAVELITERCSKLLPPVLNPRVTTWQYQGRLLTWWLRRLWATERRLFLLREYRDGMVTMAG